jgi:hypothetical protein
LRHLRSTTSKSQRFGVIPVLLIMMIWTANTAASTGPRHVRSLFDLTIEELMEIRIGAELRFGYWMSPGDNLSDGGPHEARMRSQDASQPGAAWPHHAGDSHTDRTNETLIMWDK